MSLGDAAVVAGGILMIGGAVVVVALGFFTGISLLNKRFP